MFLGAFFFCIMFFENLFIYFPQKFPNGDWSAPEKNLCSFSVNDVFIDTADEETIHGWFYNNPSSDNLLIYFHGNGGNITHRFSWACTLAHLPTNVLIIDYRGYGKSTGAPDEEGLYRDAEATLRYAKGQGFSSENITLLGESLGGGVATYLASKETFKLLILQSTFTSIPNMASKVFPFLPGFLISTQMNNLERIKEIDTPLYLVHSRRDDIVPYHMGEKLYAAAKNPLFFQRFEQYDHNSLSFYEGDTIIQSIRQEADYLTTD
jgi:uncharacterized protein